MVNANDFYGVCDSDILNAAVAARGADGIVIIPPRAVDGERDWWSLDRAILLPSNTTVVLQNCRLKLSDAARDNFFRTANAGLGIGDPQPVENIHIRGEGNAVLEGADHPRATGDSGKILTNPCPYGVEDLLRLADWIPEERRAADKLQFWDRHIHTFGTDAGKEGESQYGDWRNIGVLFANCTGFSLSGFSVVCAHGWGISLEACAGGRVERIRFDACMSKVIDGLRQNIENQDGVNLRNGCHDIVVSDITGKTGDDVVALTAIADSTYMPGGSLCTTHVMHNDWSRREADIHDVIVRNILATSELCHILRMLPCECHIYNVSVDGIIDTADEPQHHGALVLGEGDGSYGRNLPDGLHHVTVSNVVSNGIGCINIYGYLTDSVISNVINKNPGKPVLKVRRENGTRNVMTSNLVTTE
ncbi:MAG: hypothetical protein IJC53_01000 [Clostridia bacterium]|nr:hypothetical protein [Clostridia bacterium]